MILFDVWHHLRYPGTALQEFHRVLAPGGRLILFEPAGSWIGRFVYRFFHHESMTVRGRLAWWAPADFSAADADYYTAQGSATRLFWWGQAGERLKGWRIREIEPVVAFNYFASGGFSGPQLGGRLLQCLMRGLDFVTAPFPKIFAARLLIVLEKDQA